MKRLTTLLMTLMLMSTALWAEQTITVSANSSDISEGLDLKVVAKLFAEAKNLEEFETMLNNPDSAFCNLDLNGDGEVDYLRVVETGEGNKRLIVLQAVLAKDIYQDVASIYVEKDEKEQVSVQIVGDEYVYGTNYIIEPVYVYRPLIYDWFWSTAWVAWYSPWYWGYWPGWWRVHTCWTHDWYWHHCYAFHRYHHGCSFRPGRTIRSGYHELHSGVTRREYATAHPEHSFSSRNNGMTNAREIRHTGTTQRGGSIERSGVSQRSGAGERGGAIERSGGVSQRSVDRTYGSRTTAETRSSGTTQRSTSVTERSSGRTEHSSGISTRGTGTTTRTTETRSTDTRTSGTGTRSTGTSTRTAETRSAGTTQRSTYTPSYSSSSNRSTSSYSGTSNRSTGSYSGSSTRSTSSYSGTSSRSAGSYSGSSTRSTSSFSGSSSRSSSSGFSGGSSSRGGGFSGGGGGRSGGGSGAGPRR